MGAKICVITGGTSGIGLAAAKRLAREAGTVVILSRNQDQELKAVDAVQKASGNLNVAAVRAELSALEAVRAAAREILDRFGRIDILVNNAGAFYSQFLIGDEGIERTLAVNYLSHFLLTQRLMPALAASKDARIINLGSDTHRYGRIHFDDLNLERNYHGLRAYAQSKLAILLFTAEFARRCPYPNVSAYCLEPGLVRTQIGSKAASRLHGLFWRLQVRLRSSREPEEAAASIASVAFDPVFRGRSGIYLDGTAREALRSRQAAIPADSSRLWDESLRLCGGNPFFGEVAQ